jgi:hypothetical protein
VLPHAGSSTVHIFTKYTEQRYNTENTSMKGLTFSSKNLINFKQNPVFSLSFTIRFPLLIINTHGTFHRQTITNRRGQVELCKGFMQILFQSTVLMTWLLKEVFPSSQSATGSMPQEGGSRIRNNTDIDCPKRKTMGHT